MSDIPVMPFYVSDYLADTWHLSAAEHGAYCLILFTYWKMQERPDNNDETLALITRLSPAKWNNAKHKILPFFTIKDNKLYNKRLEKELHRIMALQENGRLGGIESGKTRSKQASENEANNEANAKQTGKRTASERQAKPLANANNLDLDFELDLEKKKKSSKKKKTAAPKTFTITPEMKKWAVPHGFGSSRLFAETETFLDWHRSKGNKFVNWYAAWRNWIKKAEQFRDEKDK